MDIKDCFVLHDSVCLLYYFYSFFLFFIYSLVYTLFTQTLVLHVSFLLFKSVMYLLWKKYYISAFKIKHELTRHCFFLPQ